MRVDNGDISQADATVTEKEISRSKKSTSYLLSYTFTGIHPSRGPFRMTRKNHHIGSDLYDSLEVGATVAVCYTDVDPKDCALVSDVEGAFDNLACGYKFLITILCIWIAGLSAWPLYYVYLSLREMQWLAAAVMGLFTLAASAIAIGLCCFVHFLTALCDRSNLVIQYGEDIELASAPTERWFARMASPSIRGLKTKPVP